MPRAARCRQGHLDREVATQGRLAQSAKWFSRHDAAISLLRRRHALAFLVRLTLLAKGEPLHRCLGQVSISSSADDRTLAVCRRLGSPGSGKSTTLSLPARWPAPDLHPTVQGIVSSGTLIGRSGEGLGQAVVDDQSFTHPSKVTA